MELFFVPFTFAVLGYAVGRWWVVALALAVCVGIAAFLVVNDGWYGHGWGDSGVALNAIVACLTLALATAGVAARRP